MSSLSSLAWLTLPILANAAFGPIADIHVVKSDIAPGRYLPCSYQRLLTNFWYRWLPTTVSISCINQVGRPQIVIRTVLVEGTYPAPLIAGNKVSPDSYSSWSTLTLLSG